MLDFVKKLRSNGKKPNESLRRGVESYSFEQSGTCAGAERCGHRSPLFNRFHSRLTAFTRAQIRLSVRNKDMFGWSLPAAERTWMEQSNPYKGIIQRARAVLIALTCHVA